MTRLPCWTVIYPVFDVRGEIVDRVRLWTEQQDLEPQRYRVFVVASKETELDETALRKVLRNQDALLRVPHAGSDADYWNAGAREAKTPWLLFVEAHGLPERDSLSALAAWIAASPNDVACNFRIKNLEGGRVGTLMARWFGVMHASWAALSTWGRFHRTAFAIRRDIFEEAGPFLPRYGPFAPPFLSARLHQRGYPISLIPTSCVNHEDTHDMPTHHADTADYARGEMDARAESDPVFFEKYFGASPTQGRDIVRPPRYARSMLRGLVVAALHRPGKAFALLRETCALVPAAFAGLRGQVRPLDALVQFDQFSTAYLPLPKEMRWKRFLLAHQRVVRAEQMLWVLRHPIPALNVGPESARWPIETVGEHTIIGLHALEHLGEDAFRWTYPVFLLHLAPTAKGVLTLETRNLRSQIGLSDIVVVFGGTILSARDIELDGIGNIKLSIRSPSALGGESDIVVIVKNLSEPSVANGPGRRLGLPLFSVGFRRDDPEIPSQKDSRSLPRP